MNIWKRYIIKWKNSKIKNIWIAAMNSNYMYISFFILLTIQPNTRAERIESTN